MRARSISRRSMKSAKILFAVTGLIVLLVAGVLFLTHPRDTGAARQAAPVPDPVAGVSHGRTAVTSDPSSGSGATAAPGGVAAPARLAPPSAPAQRTLWPSPFRLSSRGAAKNYRLALDEVVLRDPRTGDRVVPVSASNPAELESAISSLQMTSGLSALAVLYPESGGLDIHDRHLVVPAVTVRLDDPAQAAAVASAAGAIDYMLPDYAPGFAVLRTAGSFEALRAAEKVSAFPEVEYAAPQLAVLQAKRAMPNDPLVPGQWHLKFNGQTGAVAGTDINVEPVWAYGTATTGVRGKGILIGIVDDGVQTDHPDFKMDVSLGYDWNQGDNDPNPVSVQDNHGTACAGDAGAIGNNSRGVSGSAPEATLVGLRLIGDPSTDQQEGEAMTHASQNIQIKNNSWGPPDTGTLLQGPGPLTESAFATAVTTGRGGKGTILMWAGGNGRGRRDNSNYDGYANSIYTVAVGALDSKGRQSSYSESGANLVVCAPSDGATDALGKTTADRTGGDGYNNGSNPDNLDDPDYTNDFGGTSSATPTAAGVVALILEANPNLGWRDVQEILMRSAKKVNPTDGDWTTNGGGINHNHKFGAGLVDATAAVTLSRTWTNLGARAERSVVASGGATAVPDNNATGVSRVFDFAGSYLRVEQVTVTLTVSTVPKGQLEITLTSPNGTVSRLSEVHDDTTNTYDNWRFMTVRNWGESSNGVWTLNVADRTSGTTGSLVAATVTIHGSADARPTIVATPSNLTFVTDVGRASASKQVDVSGRRLEGPVTLRVAGNYEISTNNTTFASSLVLNPTTAGTDLSVTPVHARLKSTAPVGTARGSISLTSPNAVTQTVALNGVVFGPAGEADTFVRGIIERFLFLRPEDPPNWRGNYGYGDKLDALLPFYQSRLAAGIHPNQAKAETMMRLTGFNTSSQLFDPNDPFFEVRAAFTPYAALGITPDAASIEAFVRSMRSGRRDALPILANVPAPNRDISFNGFRDVPWGATYGVADAMRTFFNSQAFRSRYPSVANLSSRNFYNWMQDVMFPGRGMGAEGSPTLLSMLDSMSFDGTHGRAFAQAAAAAFRIVYASMLPTISSSSSNGSQVEAPFQRRLSRAALEHLFWGQWTYSSTSGELSSTGMPALMRVPLLNTTALPEMQAGAAFGGYKIPTSPEVTFYRATGLPAWLQINDTTGVIGLRLGQSVVPSHSQTTIYNVTVTVGHLLAETAAVLPLRVTAEAAPGTQASRWLTSHDLQGVRFAGAGDYDKDGLCLMSEYAFAGDPLEATDNVVRFVRNGNFTSMHWTGVGGKTYLVQSTTDLEAGWTDRPDVPVLSDGPLYSRDGVDYCPLRAEVSAPVMAREYYRIKTDFAVGELP